MKIPVLLALSLLILVSCRKDSFITSPDARVRITADTLKYDTVFVTSGSTYRTFKIINENNQKIRISSLKLMGGAGSVYSMNVDGSPGTQFSNLAIEPNDSLYVFAQVNVNPGAANLPFIIRDSIEISYNGKKRLVQLEAWGQNAHFLRNKIIAANETWNNDLPYVILGSLFVDANRTLTINKGCRIYVHADAPIVVNGTLLINGLKDTADRVSFQGDRLDEPYKDYPASWPGIFIQASSKDNVFNYAWIKNAYQAIALIDPAPLPNTYKLTLNECIIDNAYNAGIVSINSSIKARNCLISNCGNNLYLVSGNYEFTHCTVATYASSFIPHNNPVLFLSNNTPVPTNNLTAAFRNCIFWGENGLVDNEVKTDKRQGNFTVSFNNVLWKVQGTPADIAPPTGTIINNQTPRFDSINTFRHYYDFRLQKGGSPALDSGTDYGILTDLDGKSRPVGLKPDLGCFEKQ